MIDWERVARANTHPLRIAILDALATDGGRELSPRAMSFELKADLTRLSHHFRVLRDQGIIALVREEQRLGAIEHFYSLAGGG